MVQDAWSAQPVPDRAPVGPAPAPPDPDAPHEGPSLSYIPALDGIRAFAVLGVMAFHGGIPWLTGGFLGVDTFFVLSGFLITSLLIAEWNRIRTIKLGAFWARRARRLLPALLLVLLFVAFYAAVIVPRGTYPNLRLDALSTLFYVANWHFILVGTNYFNQTGMPSPLTHTWSLAIEEQFYLIWPLVVLAVMKLTSSMRVLLGVCVVGALASAAEMARLYHAGSDPTRLYYGTDTHAQCLLVGATLAVALVLFARHRRKAAAAAGAPPPWLRSRQLPGGDPAWMATSAGWRVALSVLGVAGVAVSALLWSRLSYADNFLWKGGFLVAALATAAVLVSAVCAQRSPVAVALSVAPLRFLGRISYGMYLWHYPLFIWLNAARTGLEGYALFGLRTAVTVAVATASFYLVERPIRQGTFFRDWRAWVATPVAAVMTVAVVAAATTPTAVASPPALSPPATTVPAGVPKVRVLVVGDSTALTLGIGLSAPPLEKAYDFTEVDEGQVGCGVAIGAEHEFKDQIAPSSDDCQPNPPPGRLQWPQEWQGWVDAYQPNLVILLAGRWEVVDRTYDGKWTNILDATYAAYVRAQLQLAVDVATSRGAHMVLMTAPCYDSGEQPNGQLWPEDSPARIDAYNALVREVAAANPTKVTLYDLNALVCPGGHYEEFVDGVQVRTSDGIHFTWPGGIWIGAKLWPLVITDGRDAAASQAATAPTTPSTAPTTPSTG